jgi:acyl-CoA thioesterase FadM
MTVKMEVRYKAKIPINNEYIATARIISVKGRRVIVAAEVTGSDGKAYVLSEGTFLSIPLDKLASPPEYADQVERAAGFFKLIRQGMALEDILKELGRDMYHRNR